MRMMKRRERKEIEKKTIKVRRVNKFHKFVSGGIIPTK